MTERLAGGDRLFELRLRERNRIDVVWYRETSERILAVLRFWDVDQEQYLYRALVGDELGPPYGHFFGLPTPVTDGSMLAYVVGEEPVGPWQVVGPDGPGPEMNRVLWMTPYRGQSLYCATRLHLPMRQVLCHGVREVCELPCNCWHTFVLEADRLTVRGTNGLACLPQVGYEHLLVIEDLRTLLGISAPPAKGPYR